MGVTVKWNGDKFEEGLHNAIAQELVKSAKILRRNLSTVLAQTGKSPPPSPKGTNIPFNDTGLLAKSWKASPRATRSGGKFTAGIYTNVVYAQKLITRSGSGRRNYMDENLYWYQKTIAMILKRLAPERLIRVTSRNMPD
jgi:hypothetical protein